MEHSLDSLRGGHRGIRNSLKHPERREEPEEVGDPILRATAKDDPVPVNEGDNAPWDMTLCHAVCHHGIDGT